MANIDDLMRLGDPDDIRAEIRNLREDLATERAARVEAEALAVWAVTESWVTESRTQLYPERRTRLIITDGVEEYEHDGSISSIYRALRKAKEASGAKD